MPTRNNPPPLFFIFYFFNFITQPLIPQWFCLVLAWFQQRGWRGSFHPVWFRFSEQTGFGSRARQRNNAGHRNLGSCSHHNFTLQASLSGTCLQTLLELVTPLKGHSLSLRGCPPTLSAQRPPRGLGTNKPVKAGFHSRFKRFWFYLCWRKQRGRLFIKRNV